MKVRFSFLAATVLSAGFLASACAPQQDAGETSGPGVADSGLEAVRAMVTKALPGMDVEAVQPTAVAGLYELHQAGNYGYITGDGKYLIDGDLIELASRTNLTENNRKKERVSQLAALGEENLIEFAPDGDKAQYAVTIFTDIDCGYCRKLHREVEEYNALGIAVRYAFYPRSGPDSPSFRKAEAVWCSADRKQALTLAKQGVDITGATDCENPVAREYALGSQLGLRGTPMIVLPDGEVVNGYVPAAALAERLAMPVKG